MSFWPRKGGIESCFSACSSCVSIGRPPSPGQAPLSPAPFSSRSSFLKRLASRSAREDSPGQGPLLPAPACLRSSCRARLAFCFVSSFSAFSAALQAALLHQPCPLPLRLPVPHRPPSATASRSQEQECKSKYVTTLDLRNIASVCVLLGFACASASLLACALAWRRDWARSGGLSEKV